MIRRIPRTPLLLGLAGLIPFVWGALTLYWDDAAALGNHLFGARFIGPFIQIYYGSIILSFMSGVIWGFAARGTGPVATMGYVLSVIPALWVFFMVGGGPISAMTYLAFGFAGLLSIDWLMWKNDLTPPWWMSLRILLTSIVLASLIAGIL